MRGLRLWRVLTGEVTCPPHPTAPVPPPPPFVPQALAEDATQADRDASKSAEAAADEAYEEQVLAYSEALGSYRDSLATFTQWCDEDARAAAVLSQSVQPQFASEFMGLATVAEMWSHLRQRYQPSGILCIYLYCVRSMIFSRCCRTVRSDMDFQRIHEFLSRLRPSLSLVVLSCLLEAVFLSPRSPCSCPAASSYTSLLLGGARSLAVGSLSLLGSALTVGGLVTLSLTAKKRGVPPRAPPRAVTTGFTEQDIVRLQRLLASSGSAYCCLRGGFLSTVGHSHSGPGWGWPSVP
ncbi:hypothetical protein QYE76_007968 [Lolium multiflorum]|uniref:Uncharacterized protein n=1 Tax=Lolium multiflorum TaxID=4521 RepID=A0AAD8QET3_LOLMU|nr:hypothetical protein QYE76_007968 [Lolium multiflorum]